MNVQTQACSSTKDGSAEATSALSASGSLCPSQVFLNGIMKCNKPELMQWFVKLKQQ